MKEAYQWGNTLTNSVLSVVAAYKGVGATTELLGKFLGNIKYNKMLKEAVKSGNKAEIERILKIAMDEAKAKGEAASGIQQTAQAGAEDAKARVERRKAEEARHHLEYTERQADLSKQIAEARRNLDDKKADELERIAAKHRDAHQEAVTKRAQADIDIHKAHQAAEVEAKRVYDEALEAADKLKAGNIEKLTAAEKRIYQQRVSTYSRRMKAAQAAKNAGLPKPDGFYGPNDRPTMSLSARLIDYFDKYFASEKEKIKNNDIFKKLSTRLSDMSKEGNYWGRSAEGVGLRNWLRSQKYVAEGATESDVSTYLRGKTQEVLGLLEQKPKPRSMTTPEGETVKVDVEPVPTAGEDVFKIVSDLRRTSNSMRKSGNVRWKEVMDLAEKVEGSFSDFVGEGFDVRKQYASLMTKMNELEQLDVAQIAIGRKGADYIPDSKRDRLTDRSKVGEAIFGSDNNITQLRRMMVERATTPEEATQAEAEFRSLLDHHLSNTLGDMDSAQLSQWLKPETGKGAWIDEIGEPSLRPRLMRLAQERAIQENNAAALASATAKINEFQARNEGELDRLISKVAGLSERKEPAVTRSTIEKQHGKDIAAAARQQESALGRAASEAKLARGRAIGAEKAETAKAKTEKYKETKALGEALAPQAEEVSGMQREAGVARGRRRIAKAEAKADVARDKNTMDGLRRQAQAAGGEARRMSAIVDRVQALIDSGTPQQNLAAFRKLRGKLERANVMSKADADEIEGLMLHEANTEMRAQAIKESTARVAKWAKYAITAALGATGVLTIHINKGAEAVH